MPRLKGLFRKLVELQGLIVTGARLNRKTGALELLVRRHGNAKPRCPTCDAPMGGEPREVECKWRHRDVFRKHCYLVGTVREARCPEHGRRNERVPWADTRSRHTNQFEEAVGRMVQVSNKTATAEFFDVAWRTVGRIVLALVQRFLPDDVLDGLTAIGVDETSYKRGRKHGTKFLTVASCLVTGRVVWVGEGKSSSTLGKFFELLGPERRAKIQVIAMDMSGAFRKAAKKWLPHADIVCDRFHVVQLLLDAIDEIRREEVGMADEETRKELKGARYAFLRNPKHRTPKDKAAIAAVKRANKRLYEAYQLRVDFEGLWACQDQREAARFIGSWSKAVDRSRLEPLCRFARTIADHWYDVLGFFRWNGMTNAVLEGTNNKIKLLIHKAFGFHNVEALMAMVYLCCSGIELTP